MPRDPNDAWVECRCGQRHWGLAGAAGLCLIDQQAGSVALQLRSARSHQGGTWALPGGAIQTGEAPLAAALREAAEEAAIAPEAVHPRLAYRLDHTDWSYTTVVAHLAGPRPELAALDGESADLAWVGLAQVTDLKLHPAFAAAWPTLRRLASREPALVVDAANVVGSRPDGWWRDRAGATERLQRSLAAAVSAGVPGEWFDPEAHLAWPSTVIVTEGAGRAAGDPPAPVEVARAPASGDDEIVRVVCELVNASDGPVVVATADRGLIARLPAAASSLGPGTLRRRLDTAD